MLVRGIPLAVLHSHVPPSLPLTPTQVRPPPCYLSLSLPWLHRHNHTAAQYIPAKSHKNAQNRTCDHVPRASGSPVNPATWLRDAAYFLMIASKAPKPPHMCSAGAQRMEQALLRCGQPVSHPAPVPAEVHPVAPLLSVAAPRERAQPSLASAWRPTTPHPHPHGPMTRIAELTIQDRIPSLPPVHYACHRERSRSRSRSMHTVFLKKSRRMVV